VNLAVVLPVNRAVVDVFTSFFFFIVVAFFSVSVLLSMLVTTIIAMSVPFKSFISRVVDLFLPTEILLLKKVFFEETALTAFLEATQRSDHQFAHDISVTIFKESLFVLTNHHRLDLSSGIAASLREPQWEAVPLVLRRRPSDDSHGPRCRLRSRAAKYTGKKPVLDVHGCASYAVKAAGYAAKRETRSKAADRTLGFKASQSEPDRGRVALFQATLCSILERDYSAQELAALSTSLKSVEHSFVFKHCALTTLARVEYKNLQ